MVLLECRTTGQKCKDVSAQLRAIFNGISPGRREAVERITQICEDQLWLTSLDVVYGEPCLVLHSPLVTQVDPDATSRTERH